MFLTSWKEETILILLMTEGFQANLIDYETIERKDAMESLVQQTDVHRLGRILAVVYEEGHLEACGLMPDQVVLALCKGQSQVVLAPVFQRRNTMPVYEQLATIQDFPHMVLADDEVQSLYRAYQSELVQLIYKRWFGFFQYVREVI